MICQRRKQPVGPAGCESDDGVSRHSTLGGARVVKPCTPAQHRIPSMEASWRHTPAVSARCEADQLGGQRLAATKETPVALSCFLSFLGYRHAAVLDPERQTGPRVMLGWLDRLARQTASRAPSGGRLLRSGAIEIGSGRSDATPPAAGARQDGWEGSSGIPPPGVR